MNNIEEPAVGKSSKQFFIFREGDTAFTLQRSLNSSGQFLLLTELKASGSRRSIIIPEGKEKFGWRAFGLELRKLLNPSHYAVGGYGLPKFIPQVRRFNLESQNSRTFAEVVQGFHEGIEDRRQLKQLGYLAKGKKTQLREEKKGVNLRLKGAKVGIFPVGKSDKMEVVRGDRKELSINEETEVGVKNHIGSRLRCPIFSLNSKDYIKGKKSVDRRSCWSGRNLIVEVDVTGSRRVFWDRRKGGDTKCRGVSRAMDRDYNIEAPRALKWVARESKKARDIKKAGDKPGLGLDTSPLLIDSLKGPFLSVFLGPSFFVVGESSLTGEENSAQALTVETYPKSPPQHFDTVLEGSDRCAKPPMGADDSFFAGTSFDEPTLPPGKSDTVISRSSVELFLSSFFWCLSRAGLVVTSVNNGVDGGWDSSTNLRSLEALDYDQPSVALIPMKAEIDVPGVSTLVVGELNHSDLGLGGEDSLPLMSVTPSGLPLSADLICGNEALECMNTVDISSWVKNKLPGFSKLVGLPLSCHEKLCIALLQKIEKETEDAKVLNRKDTVPRKAVINRDKGKRELRNLQSSVNYDGR